MNFVARISLVSTTAALALGMSNQAHALSCQEIMNMVDVNVPTNIVVQTMRDSGEQFTPDEVRCLADRGAPDDVVGTARGMMASEEPAAEPAPAVRGGGAKEAESDRGMEADEDVIGSRVREDRGDDLPERGDEGARDPDQIKQAVKLIRAKKPLTASLMLYEMLEDKRFPDQETKIHYYLARALGDLEMYHSAQYHYMQVVKKGVDNPYFNYALPKLVAIARYTGDDTELQRIVAKIPPEAFPRGAQHHMNYLLGVRYYDKGELSRAGKYFGKVSTKSPLYLKSEYFRGVIYNQMDKLKSAVRSFRDVVREEGFEVYDDAKDLDEIESIKDMSLVNIARIYYGIERFEESSKYYDLVSRDSPYWAQSLFEHAWANFMQNRLNESLGQLLTVRSPFYRHDEFIPEADILRALTYFNLCEYNEVEKLLIRFEDSYRPMQVEMRDFVKQYATAEGKKMSDQAWDTYFEEGRKRDTVLPKSLFTKTLRNQSLSGLVRHMEIMDAEIALIDQQKSRWQDSVGSYLKKIIEKDRQRYKKRAGRLLLSEMARNANYLSDLLTQSEIVRFEVVDAQRVDYQYKAKAGELDVNLKPEELDFATSIDFIYWPFNGEFWQDELGYYRYTEQGSCK